MSRRTEVRDELLELRDLVWEWDPVNLRSDRSQIEDEYDCIVHPVWNRLHAGDAPSAIEAFLVEFLPRHFGLEAHGARSFADAAVLWHESRRHNTTNKRT